MNTALRLYACASASPVIYVISLACEIQQCDFGGSLKSRINRLDGLQSGGRKGVASGWILRTNFQ